ncbi:C13 family peptidase [Roseomonas sp. CCTCC AB2023176]|uniref:C13 family peptidase n=1 Tax=Roseomonas sp. CCTCC AB2023176 TaxID=3342640 RepID=UPI0035DE866F
MLGRAACLRGLLPALPAFRPAPRAGTPGVQRRATGAAVALLAALLSLAACAPGAVPSSAPVAAVPQAPTRWHAILVAGDPSLPVWDNAVERFARSMPDAASSRRFSAAGRPGAAPATIPNVLQTIAALRPGPGEGCLVFLTMHGAPGRGLAFVQSNQTLGPGPFQSALSRGCGDAPTVVVASGCYTGSFAPALAAPNRVVLTAARADRPSFGCGAGYTYTVFDSCLLDALDANAPRGWTAVSDATLACVAAEEARLRERPSEPQRSITPALAGEPIRWAPAPSSAAGAGGKR